MIIQSERKFYDKRNLDLLVKRKKMYGRIDSHLYIYTFLLSIFSNTSYGMMKIEVSFARNQSNTYAVVYTEFNGF